MKDTRYVVDSETGEILQKGYYNDEYYYAQDPVTDTILERIPLTTPIRLTNLRKKIAEKYVSLQQNAILDGFSGPIISSRDLRLLA